MHDALKPAIVDWVRQVIGSIDVCIDSNRSIDLQQLARTLTPVSMWQGCPRAEDVRGDSADICYRRIPLTDAVARGYEALLILWPPGHATPVHDHDGLWGMEFVLDGVLQVEAFDLSLQEHPHLVSRDTTVLGIGDHVAFSNADYAHRCRNLSSNRPTLSLHIYGGELNSYRSFHAEEEDRWVSRTHVAVRDSALT